MAKASATLPRHRQDEQEIITPGACSRTGLGGAGFHNFVLLCIPFMRVATKLYQPEICRINSDQEFFQLLRHYYRTRRGKSPWKWLRKVKSINFVKFEVYRSHLVDVRLCPSVPPPDRIGTEYAFDAGAQLDVVPPIGPNLLAHLFEHPEHADVTPIIWNRIPRKLRAELTACPTRGSSLGWGLQLAEGMEWFLFFVLGCAGFLACLLIATVWSVARSDIQGGFSIGGFLLAFWLFCGGIAHTAVAEYDTP